MRKDSNKWLFDLQIQILSENIVIYIFTLGSKFIYKGMPNDDLPINS